MIYFHKFRKFRPEFRQEFRNSVIARIPSLRGVSEANGEEISLKTLNKT